MRSGELETLVRYQTCLFTALAGILVGRALTTRTEIAAALKVIGEEEDDVTVQILLRILGDILTDIDPDQPVTMPFAPFEIIAGGKA